MPRRRSACSATRGREWRCERLLFALVFLAVHHVYTPLHLSAEEHFHVHGDHHHAPCADAGFDGGPRSTHEPHPASDHGLTSGIPRASAQLDLDPVRIPGAPRLVAPLDPEPRTRPAPVPLLRPRPPPPLSSCRPRAPPAA